MQFSSGDLIAIFIGSTAALRWLLEKYFSKNETDEDKVRRLEMAFEVYKSAAVEREKSMNTTLSRIERSVSNMQRQMGLLVSGGGNKFFEITADGDRPNTES